MRTHNAMKANRAEARRELAKIRTTRIDARHENVSDDLVDQHWAIIATEDDE